MSRVQAEDRKMNMAGTVLFKETMMKYLIVQAMRKDRTTIKTRGMTLIINKVKLYIIVYHVYHYNEFIVTVYHYNATYEFQSESTFYSLPECQEIPCSNQAPYLKFKLKQRYSNPQLFSL